MQSEEREEKPLKKGKQLALGSYKISLKTLVAFIVSLFIFLILLIALSVSGLFRKPPQKPASLPSPTPIATPSEERIASPSAYATDSAILKIEKELNAIDNDLQLTDLKESGLAPPVLDMKIEFKE